MLSQAFETLHNGDPESTAQVPLVALVAVYFCLQIASKDDGGGLLKTETGMLTAGSVDLNAARQAACANLNESLSLLPRLSNQGALLEQQTASFRRIASQMKAWAEACSEPMSLGAIHAFSRVQWVHWHVRIVGSNSVPLQVFLYLCEKRRLQAFNGAAPESDYEHLIGNLLNDVRVTQQMLGNGRPRTVSQCIKALREWCNMPTRNGETREELEGWDASLIRERGRILQNSNQVRDSELLYAQIAGNNFRVTKDMHNLIAARKGKYVPTNSTALMCYLNWEMSPPSCLDLEVALFQAVRGKPEWGKLHMAALLSAVQHTPGWLEALRDALCAGLRSLPELQNSSGTMLAFGQSFQVAILKAGLKKSGWETSLKGAIVSVVQRLPGWQDTFADRLVKTTMPKWDLIFTKFKIDALSRSLAVQSFACIDYLLPADTEWHKGGRKNRNDVVGEILRDFLAKARPTLEGAYGKNPDQSTCREDPSPGNDLRIR